ncbi:N-acetyltransferase family protein [Acinetobacter bereziniae]|uniref:GNAT family N-acetyltransferase n=1 Tax=Acinetobacter bereziniae TaxID=106648 RepID=UPI0039C2CA68
MCIQIRLAAANDIETIFDIRTSVKENHLSRTELTELGITTATISELIHSCSCVWVAELNDQVCGFAIADQDEGSIFAMFVYPDFEAKGIGTALLKKAEDFLFQYFQEICLETDARSRACAFYAQHGWRVVEHFENHDVKMMKQAR